MKNLLKYGTMVIAIVFVLISCDTDPNELGGDFLGIDLDNTIIEEDFEVRAFSAPLNPVQTNNFGLVQLGAYDDPVYGRTTYDFVTQLSLNNVGVDFGQNRKLDSVVLTIPYFSSVSGVNVEATEYQLDSVYGQGGINFKVFRNNFFLNSFDPNNVEQAANYFSDFGQVIDANKGLEIEFVDDDGTTVFDEITNFKPENEEIVLINVNDSGDRIVTDRLSPRFRQELEPQFWKDLILDQADASYLSSDSNFQNFFRGLYFQVTSVDANDGGVLSYLNLSDASIILYYRSDIIDVNDLDNDGDTTDFIQEGLASSYRISLAGTRATLLETEVPNQIQTDVANSFDPINGSERIYIKGGEGAMTFIDLFGPDQDNDGEADALTTLKRKEIIVNEANLEFFVDQSVFTNADSNAQPERIFIYDFETRSVLSDFLISGNGIAANTNHLGRLERDDDGSKYRIRITRHIENILSGDVDNNRLGLFVSQNVALLGSGQIKNQTQPIVIESIPISSAISHEGTVLHGNLSSEEDKRLKLKIFYTEVN